MSPLALVHIDIYALIVSINSDLYINNGAKPSLQSGQKITLTENFIPNLFIEDGLPNRHNKPVLTQTAGLMDPIVQVAVKNSFRMQVKKKSEILLKRHILTLLNEFMKKIQNKILRKLIQMMTENTQRQSV